MVQSAPPGSGGVYASAKVVAGPPDADARSGPPQDRTSAPASIETDSLKVTETAASAATPVAPAAGELEATNGAASPPPSKVWPVFGAPNVLVPAPAHVNDW